MSTSEIKPIPPLSLGLIEALDARFPSRSPTLKMSDHERGGRSRVLKVEMQRQEEDAAE